MISTDQLYVPPSSGGSAPHFQDGFGRRWLGVEPDSGEPVEVLSFDPELILAPDFAATLGVRVARLAGARHTSYARVRRLDRPAQDALLLISDRVAGWRLSDVLAIAEREALSFDISAVLSLLRQLIPAVSLFARHQRDLAIGAVGPERLILTPQGRLVLAEYVLGPAIDKLRLSNDRLWRQLRVIVADGNGPLRCTPRSDVYGIGVVALSLLLGRRLSDDEFPERLAELLGEVSEWSGGVVRPLSPALATWLGRALQLDDRTAFQTPHEAQVSFEEVLASERGYVTSPALLDAFLSRFAAVAGAPPEPIASNPEPAVAAVAAVLEREESVADVLVDEETHTAAETVAVAEQTQVEEPEEPVETEEQVEPEVQPSAKASSIYDDLYSWAPRPPKISWPEPVEAQQPAVEEEPAIEEPQATVVPSYSTSAAPPAAFDAAPIASAAPTASPFEETSAGIEEQDSTVRPVGDDTTGEPSAEALASDRPAPASSESDAASIPAYKGAAEVTQPQAPRGWLLRGLIAASILALVEAITLGWMASRAPASGLGDDGELVVSSRPAAARVSIDGEDRGATPVTVRLSPGAHVLEVRVARSEPRVIPLQIRAGVQTAQYVELQSVPTVGALDVRSDPAKVRVSIDGQDRGVTPLTIRDLPPGEHEVVLDDRAGRKVKQVIRLEAGVTAQLVVPMGTP